MGLIGFVYLLLTVVIAGSAAFSGALSAAFYCLASSILALVATSGIVLGLRSSGASYRVGTPIAGLVGVAIAFWLAAGFSFGLFGFHGEGPVWAGIGCVVGLLFGFQSKPMA